MSRRLPDDYAIDPADPRAPPEDVWARMSPEQRDRVVAELPARWLAPALLIEPPLPAY